MKKSYLLNWKFVNVTSEPHTANSNTDETKNSGKIDYDKFKIMDIYSLAEELTNLTVFL